MVDNDPVSDNATPPLLTPADAQRALADRLRQARLHRDWKQSTLAERSGVSLATLRRYEKTGNTSVENLLRMIHALGSLPQLDGLLLPPAARTMAELEASSTEASSTNDRPRRGRR